MATKRTKMEVIERQFLPVRAKILEIAAALDRVDRAAGPQEAQHQLDQLHQALEVLQQSGDDRAEQVQQIFSREYDDLWQEKFGSEQSASRNSNP